MTSLLSVRFNFLCRNSRITEHGESPIILRVLFSNDRRDLYTGLYCKHSDWDNNFKKVSKKNPESKNLNDTLDLILRKAQHSFDQLKFSEIIFTIDDVANKIKGKNEKPTLLIEYIEKRNEQIKLRVGVEITKGTYFKYRRSLQNVKEFLHLEYRAKNFPLQKIDTEFLEKYFYYLRTTRNNSNNSAYKSLQFIKVILGPAIRTRILKVDPFEGLKFKLKKTFPEFLTEEEIELIASAELESKDLERVRDIFLFGCYTGLAYVDLKQLSSFHIIQENDRDFYILKARQKTGEQSIIPLLKPAIAILRKYTITDNISSFKWYVSSNQKMNFRLKIIGEKIALAKTLHMHLARHTFATTITLSHGVPIETVSRMLGHASIKQTQHYAKVVAQKIKNDMMQLNKIYK
jgi:site-specific recombinase XerD